MLKPFRYASVCDGIGAVHCAWQSLGWQCAWTSEIEKFPIAVVEQRWGYPNLGDMTAITERELEQHGTVNLLVGGTPCQSFSIAGLRGGMDDARGNLALRFMQLAGHLRPEFVVWENVPGVLSSNEGRDVGSILGALAELWYGWAYRILDAQFFGVAQRRRRVFVVGCLRDWRRAAAVLFERDCLQGHSSPRIEARKDIVGALDAGAGRRRGSGMNSGFPAVSGTLEARYTGSYYMDGGLIPSASRCLNAGGTRRNDYESETLIAFSAKDDGQGAALSISPTIKSGGGMAIHRHSRSQNRLGVRRLTPRECERLQGLEDDYTAITYRNKPAADALRYKALGNSMAVPVMQWIGERIMQVHSMEKTQ